MIKLVTQSLIKLHKQALVTVGDGQLGPDSIVDARYPHSEVRLKQAHEPKVSDSIRGARYCSNLRLEQVHELQQGSNCIII